MSYWSTQKRKQFYIMFYGWKCKSPIRKRMIDKALHAVYWGSYRRTK